jgi:hypothetical protein
MARMPQRLVRGLLAAVLLVACSASNSAFQQPQGTARVAGRVTRIDTGERVGRATVVLSSLGNFVEMGVSADATGNFEFKNVPAGDYWLIANAAGWVSADATPSQPRGIGKPIKLAEGQQLEGLELPVARMPAIEGRLLDPSNAPVPGVPVSLVQLRYVAGKPVMLPVTVAGGSLPSSRTDADGKFRFTDLMPGDYYVLATVGPFGSATPSQMAEVPERLLSYAPTFFPGTDRIAGARSVRVEIGIDAFNASFALVPFTNVKMSGTVLDVNGRAVADAIVDLIPMEDGGIQADLGAKVNTDASGRFAYRGIPSGVYALQCYGRQGLFGSKLVVVPAVKEEFSGIDVTVRPRVNARGRLTFEDGPPPQRNRVTATFVPTDFALGPVGSNALIATIHDDWTFEFSGLAWFGLIRATAGSGWALKSVRRNGRDITDEPSDFQSGDVDGLELVMTRHLASITGTVTDGNNRVAYAHVLILPENSERILKPPRSRMAGSTGADGSFKIADLLPGRYRILAVPSVSAIASPPDWLLSLHPLGTPVTVTEDESKTMSLKLVRK